ncbi:MAG: glycosyltransferase [Cyclobacteriaceae bacterium]|jgi:glycosyltransferase involved in cell wall biosynthesis|nr:glycosyltransferase [Cyclobacteriaceae bacterium]
MNFDVKVSIILPTHNRAHLLPRAINSVLNQTYPNWELIIVDDGSTDNTKYIIDKFNDRRIKYIQLKSNVGAPEARNIGMVQAKGDFITFLDSDDEYYNNKVEKQLKLFRDSSIPNLGVVSCGRHDFRNKKKYFEWTPTYRGNILKPLLSKRKIGSGTPFLMIKRVIVDEGIFFDPDMPAGQDYDFLVRVCLKYNFDFVEESLVKVHHHSGERVYNHERAILAFELQYKKYRYLLLQDKSVHERFILKQCDLYFSYLQRDRALQLLQTGIPFFTMRKYLWFLFFKNFKSLESLKSRILISLLRKI